MDSELKPPAYLSPSSISTFKQCPLRFKYNKIDLIPDPSNHWAVLGNFVHDILEEMYKLAPAERNLATCKMLAKALWDEKWGEEAHKVLRTEKEIHNFRWSAWWCVENLWLIENPQEVSPIGLEHELNGEIGGVALRGFIDRYSQTEGTMMLTVSDYKTGKTPKYDLDEKFFQLLIYAKLLSNTGVGEVDNIELLYLKEGVKLKKAITDSDIKMTVEEVQRVKSEVDERCVSGNFEYKTSGLCNFCSYKRICPAWNR